MDRFDIVAHIAMGAPGPIEVATGTGPIFVVLFGFVLMVRRGMVVIREFLIEIFALTDNVCAVLVRLMRLIKRWTPPSVTMDII